VELLAAMAVLTLLVAALFGAFNQAQKVWLTGENRVQTFQSARATLEFMARELSQAVASTNLMFYGTPTSVYFVAPLSTSATDHGDLCEVGYEFDGSSGVWKITRRFTAPTTANTTPGGAWNIYAANWNTSWDPDPVTQACLASNCVLNLGFEYFGAAGSLGSNYSGTNLPRAVQITIDVIDARSAERFRLSSAAAITNENRRTFTTVAQLPNGRR
jgi:hypothetical protein